MKTKDIGDYGEKLARRYLRFRGYWITDKNYRTGHGEIDIVARKGRYIVFVEVKTRKAEHTESYGRPALAVTYTKREHIRYAITDYLRRSNNKLEPRIDIIEVYLSGGKHRIEHIKNAFGAMG